MLNKITGDYTPGVIFEFYDYYQVNLNHLKKPSNYKIGGTSYV